MLTGTASFRGTDTLYEEVVLTTYKAIRRSVSIPGPVAWRRIHPLCFIWAGSGPIEPTIEKVG